jgi:hypothetical protein
MRYYEISKAMSSLYFGLDVFCQLEARVPEFDAVFRVQCSVFGASKFPLEQQENLNIELLREVKHIF